MTGWSDGEPEMTVAWLFGTEPTDRALAGWAPNSFVRVQYGTFLRYYAGDPPLLTASAGDVASSP